MREKDVYVAGPCESREFEKRGSQPNNYYNTFQVEMSKVKKAMITERKGSRAEDTTTDHFSTV